jgi:threonine dehydrogenase-like Zn-dependent dehydrogenase
MSPPARHRLLTIQGPGKVQFVEAALPAPGPGDVLVRPLLSTFKHGTEMMAYSGDSPFARRTFNAQLRLFEEKPGGEAFYPRPMGSMFAGRIEWTGGAVQELGIGQLVYGWGPIADLHLMPAGKLLPLGALSPEQALCIDPASFALGAALDGAIGAQERVLITGLGAIGLFAVQYCRAFGAQVHAASHFAARREIAASFGAYVYDPAETGDLARTLKGEMGGVDAAIECSGNVGTLQTAIRAVRPCGRVVCVGFYGPADARLNLGEEFFHNRISLLASLPALSWGNPVRSEPPLHAADLQARVAEDFRTGLIVPDRIIAPVLPFAEAERAAAMIAEEPESVVKLVLAHEPLETHGRG